MEDCERSIRVRPAAGGAFGIDVLLRGAEAVARGEDLARRLAALGIRATARRRDDGCAVALGPLSCAAMVVACRGLVW